jgi:hypothetical protein
MDQFLAALHHFVGVIPSSDSSMFVYIAGFAEILMRYVPSQKPLSVIHASAEGFHVLGDGLEKIAKILDRVFGQNQAAQPAATAQAQKAA